MRIFIYPADIMAFTGKSYPTANRLYNLVLDAYGKITRDANQKIISKEDLTIRDYCMYHGLDEQEITLLINKK